MRGAMRWQEILAAVFVLSCAVLIAQGADVPRAATAPVGSEYRLGPEDVIDVFVWKEPELTTSVVIRPDGKISLPLTNEIVASGKTVPELQQEIKEKLKQFIDEPVVNVIVKQVNSLKISVLGEVRKPDLYRMKNQTTVLDAIALAGGLTEFAKKNVTVIRNGPNGGGRIKVSLKGIVEGGRPFYLQPGDTVYVE